MNNMLLKRNNLFCLFGIMFLTMPVFISCSQVFDAGVSGQVFYYNSGSKVGVPDVDVYVYTSEKGNVVAKAKTNADGNFTVNRIVWETKKSDFGKTADYETIWIEVLGDDKSDYKQKLQGRIPVRIVSDSTNADGANIEMKKIRYSMPTFTGQVDDTTTSVSGTAPTENDFDNKKVWLCSEKSLDSLYPQRAAYTYTTSAQVRSDAEYSGINVITKYVYSHGNFTVGGASVKYMLTDEQLEQEYPEQKVYLLFDYNDDGSFSSGDKYAEITFQCSETNVRVLTKDFIPEP